MQPEKQNDASSLVLYHLKMNEVIEVANKNIKKIVEKMDEKYKDWHEKLPFTLHTYRTIV